MLKKFVVATLACLTIFLSRRAMVDSHLHRPEVEGAQNVAPEHAAERPIRTASAL